MEEELLKHNTDCVYFLASPLTCKKGIDCEYRHSEIARLNPRDCWYWLAGNCINPNCSFRHPPLDGHALVSSESAALSYQCSAPANKTNLPCYFYFNSFCNKGDRCSFLHGPDHSGFSGKSLKNDALPLDHKTSIENDARAVQTETHSNPSKTAPNSSKDTDMQLKEGLQQLAPKTMIQEEGVPPRTSVFEFREAVFVNSGSLLVKEGTTQSRTPICTDESSEEQMDDYVEPEDRWESSPGFDVLVDNKSEDLDHENDSEYLLAPDGDQRENFLSYDYEDSVQHETRCPNVEFLCDRDVYDTYEDSENECTFDSARNPPAHPRDRRSNSIFFQKRRRLLPVELSIGEQISVDLRDYLRQRRVVEGNPLNCLSRRSEYSHLIGRGLERPRRSMGWKLRRRLASTVGKHSIESMGDHGCSHKGTNQRGWLKHLEPNRSTRQPFKGKRLKGKRQPRRKTVSSEVSRNLISREWKPTDDASSAFTGPKTLAQIKEEKRRTKENNGAMRH